MGNYRGRHGATGECILRDTRHCHRPPGFFPPCGRADWYDGESGSARGRHRRRAYEHCFDHNLGTWRDIPGCWFSQTITDTETEIIVADRGQGFLGSLTRVRPDLRDAADTLRIAFTTQISGRAPEQRGKGLRFILDALVSLPGTIFLLHTGDARMSFQSPIATEEIPATLQRMPVSVHGTYAALTIPRNGDTVSPL